jgi:UDP-N-acetylglucosamine transferase subunit ALG13
LELCYKTFVSIGNGKQNFLRLLNAVTQLIDYLPKPILIQSGHTPFSYHECDVVDFVSMDNFIRHVTEAQLLIFHAGAGSVLNAIRAGKRPIVMPRRARFDEHVNDHQVEFAKILHSAGKVFMVQDTDGLRLTIEKFHEEDISLKPIDNPPAFDVIKTLLARLLSEGQ